MTAAALGGSPVLGQARNDGGSYVDGSYVDERCPEGLGRPVRPASGSPWAPISAPSAEQDFENDGPYWI